MKDRIHDDLVLSLIIVDMQGVPSPLITVFGVFSLLLYFRVICRQLIGFRLGLWEDG